MLMQRSQRPGRARSEASALLIRHGFHFSFSTRAVTRVYSNNTPFWPSKPSDHFPLGEQLTDVPPPRLNGSFEGYRGLVSLSFTSAALNGVFESGQDTEDWD